MPAVANEDQDRFWNEIGGPLWVAGEAETEQHTHPFGDAALVVAAPRTGEHVLDVGCGCGSTTLALARAVGPTGTVVGVDISAAMVRRAEEHAADAGLEQVGFRQADAQSAPLGTSAYDLVFSRFGVMFFADPPAAFANLRRALRPTGRLVFVCWQAPSANLWMAVPNRTALAFFGLTPPPHDAPGPFSLADPDRIRNVLGEAGFTKIDIAAHRQPLRLAAGTTVDSWAHQRLTMGPARQCYLEASSDRQAQARRQLADAVSKYHDGDALCFEGAATIVTATP